MKNLNRFFKLTLAFLLLNIAGVLKSNAQDNRAVQQPDSKIKSAEWQPLLSNEFIEVKYRYDECKVPSHGTHYENVYLQFINKTVGKLKVEWNTEHWYNGKCIGCEAGNMENHKILLLEPKAIKEGSCTEECNNDLKIFSKMLNFQIKSELSDFNLKNLVVTPVSN